jgi:hypothetical protein
MGGKLAVEAAMSRRRQNISKTGHPGRGGSRKGAGRKPGSKSSSKPSLEPASPPDEMPLAYMLRLMRDGTIDPKRP